MSVLLRDRCAVSGFISRVSTSDLLGLVNGLPFEPAVTAD
jgi:hypothetical protein